MIKNIKDYAYAAVFKGLAAVSSVLLAVLVSNFVDIDSAGIFYFSLTFVTVVGVLFRQGFDNIILRYFSFDPKEFEKYSLFGIFLSRVLKLSIPVVFLLISILMLLQRFVPDYEYLNALLGISIAIPFISFFTLHSFIFQAEKKIFLHCWFQNLGINTFFILGFFLIWLVADEPSHVSLVILYLFSSVFVFLTITPFIYKNHSKYFDGLGLLNADNIISDSNELWIASVYSIIVQWSPLFVLGLLASPSDVAFFASAYRLAMVLNFILMIVNLVNARKYAQYWNSKNIKGIAELSFRTSLFMSCILIPLCLIITFNKTAVMSIYGQEYSSAGNLLAVLLLGQAFSVLAGSVGYILNMTGHYNELKKSTFISAIAAAVGCFIFIPLYGALGAAITTSLTLILQNTLAIYYIKKRLGFIIFLPYAAHSVGT